MTKEIMDGNSEERKFMSACHNGVIVSSPCYENGELFYF